MPDADRVSDTRPKAKIFISYSRKDMIFADRLEAALKARGFEPLIDRAEIYAFEDWWKRIEALIGRADTVVFVMSPDAVASDVALKEVAHAASLNKRFAPIVCRRTEDGAVPETLRRLNFVFFDDPARFEVAADQLAEALQTDIGWVRQHTEYGEAARRWAAAGRKGGLLLRSPVLEEAESWIASRPRGAPEPTPETQTFVADSRRSATKRRNILTGSLGAGLIVALVLAGLAFWQREVAVQQQQIADQQRKRAEDTLAAATKTANSLVFDLAQRFEGSVGIPVSLIKDILDRARGLQQQLVNSGQVTPDLLSSESSALLEMATALIANGDGKGALSAAEQARQIASNLLSGSPANVEYQRDLVLALSRIGDVQNDQGNLASALKAYRDGLAISGRLAKANPQNGLLQRDVSVAYDRIGDVQVRQGDVAAAIVSYRDSVAVIDPLAKANPGNSDWQRDLSVSLNKLGDAQSQQGDIVGALKSYRDSLAIRKQLSQLHPGDGEALQRVAVADENVGDLLLAQGDLAGALQSFTDSFKIMDRLARSDSTNRSWQRSLAEAYEDLGNVQLRQRNLADALKSYQGSFDVSTKLAAVDPSNGVWQRDLAIAYEKVGDAQDAQKDFLAAIKSYHDGSALLARLATANPDISELKQDLIRAAARIGNVSYELILARDFANALEAADESIALEPGTIWLYSGQAYALMFLGRTGEARALFLKYRGQQDGMSKGELWDKTVLRDFSELRKAGLTNPLMDEIEKLFTSAG